MVEGEPVCKLITSNAHTDAYALHRVRWKHRGESDEPSAKSHGEGSFHRGDTGAGPGGCIQQTECAYVTQRQGESKMGGEGRERQRECVQACVFPLKN